MNKITVKTIVATNVQKAWDSFTQTEHVVNWNHASEDWHCPKATNDLKVGGQFNYTMASKDGKYSFDFNGIYSEIIERKKINYNIEGGREVTVLFDENNEKTTVTEIFDPEDVNPIEMQRQGWQSILENFKIYVEKN